MKEKEKKVTLTIDGSELTIVVKRPAGKVVSDAQRVSAKVWTDCVRDGIMTKKELKKFMKENGVWDDKKDNEQEKLNQEIINLEKRLYLGDKLTTSEAKKIAIEMRVKRNELRELIGERLSLEQNTAESLSDNARFDFLVSQCTFKEDGVTKFYSSIDEYNANSEADVAVAAATALAEIMYSLDKDFEARLPENKFLIDHNLVNDDLSLVNEDGQTVDLDGRLINEFGYYINDKGDRIDKDGNLLDNFGNYVPTVEYVDDNKPVVAKKTRQSKKKEESVSS